MKNIFQANFCFMDDSTRLQYLEIMGVESWQFRQPLSVTTTLPIEPTTESAINTGSVAGSVTTAQIIPAEAPVLASVVPSVSAPDNWGVLRQEVTNCTKCSLCTTRTQTVFGTGNQNPDWLFIGEAPGEQEDLQGHPFVGVAGTLLTEMIRAIGLSREQVFIANILKCRPPGNRDPKVEESVACRPFLERQIALLKPKIIVAVGRIAAQQLLGTNETIGKLRGKVYQLNGIPLVIVYHPAYLLRSLSQKAKAWQDLQLALKTYQDIKGA
jgi:DNA polymerase